MEGWARLSMYESTELVRESFRRLRNRDLQLERAQEIVSAFAQGREYFSAAEHAGLLVRPLLQYYGALSLSRGLVLFLNTENLRENALPPSHGLAASSWGQVLAHPNRSVADLEVDARGGTFGHLLRCTSDLDFVAVFIGEHPNRLFFNPQPLTADVNGMRFSLKQILARIPELRRLYERTFDEVPCNYRTFIYSYGAEERTTVDMFQGSKELDEHEIRQLLSIPGEVAITQGFRHRFFPHAPHLSYTIAHTVDRPFPMGLPQFELSEGDVSIIAPFGNNVRLSRLSRLFVLAFYLGTLARYHPTAWLSIMQGRQNGGRLLPLMRESMDIVQRLFPQLVIGVLEPVAQDARFYRLPE